MSSDDQADTEAVYIENARETVSPFAGTFTLTYRHGVSDPVFHNAPAVAVRKAAIQAGDRDYVIAKTHFEDPVAYALCKICNPPAPEYDLPVRSGYGYLKRVRLSLRAAVASYRGEMFRLKTDYFPGLNRDDR